MSTGLRPQRESQIELHTMLVVILLAAMGGFMAWSQYCEIAEYFTLQSWVETPARIIRAELTTTKDDPGRNRVVAEYEYRISANDYRGSRVSLRVGSEQTEDREFQELKGYQTREESFRCYANPNQPADSILYRDVPFETIGPHVAFVLLYAGFTWGILIVLMRCRRAERRQYAIAIQHPDEPWLWRQDWAAKAVEPDDWVAYWILVFGALFWNGLMLQFWWKSPEVLVSGDVVTLVLLTFLAVGIGLAIGATRAIFLRLSYGRCQFRMNSVPGLIGATLEGTIETGRRINSEQVELRLVCEDLHYTDENKHLKEPWQQDQTVEVEQRGMVGTGGGTVVPVLFEIPESCRPSDEESIQWILTLTARRLRWRFVVPIFAIPAK